MPLLSSVARRGTCDVTWSVPAPPETVWPHLVEPARLGAWLGEVRAGAVIPGSTLVVDHGQSCLSRSVVEAADAPHHIAMTWDFPGEPPSRVDVTLTPASRPDRMTLNLRHTQLGRLAADYRVGWLVHLTFLEAAVAGVPLPETTFWALHETFRMLLERGDVTA